MSVKYKLQCCGAVCNSFVSTMGVETCPYCFCKDPAIEEIEQELGNRPWGMYMILLETPYTKVKKIVVNPNQKLSLQYHNHRSEVWTIVKGDGVFTNGKDLDYVVFVGDTIEIKQGAWHRITAGDEGVTFIEVQLSSGGTFDEDDIIRIEDDYGRVE